MTLDPDAVAALASAVSAVVALLTWLDSRRK